MRVRSVRNGNDAVTASRATKLLLIFALVFAAMGVTTAAQQPSVVRVDTGELQGLVDGGVASYKGIPFGGPAGDLRWRPPQPAARWSGVRPATEFGADCMQGVSARRHLVLPLQRPARVVPAASAERARRKIVVPQHLEPGFRNSRSQASRDVCIFGGGFVFGSSALPNTSGTEFAKHGVILVAANYRVGRFGFFAFPSLSNEHRDEPKGNYAYMDQIAALKWVQRNIAAFGGDPNNVTIFGFSQAVSPSTAF